MTTSRTTDKISRRTLTGVAAAGVGVPLLAACGDDADSAADPAGESASSSASASQSPSSAAPSSSAPSESASSAAPEGFTTTADVEVGGGTIYADEEVVVTQPSEGQFKCFTAICSHQGCLVTSVSDGTINCDCHGSKYSIEDGSVEQGPATFALEEQAISVDGDQISLA